MSVSKDDEAMDIRAAANYIGCSAAGLRSWRSHGRGPRYYRAGRLVRYRKSDLDKWIEKQSCEPLQGKDGTESKQ